MSIRGDILQAAAELLADSPTGDVSTRAICERAGVQAPTLYRHFGDKDSLLAAVVDDAFTLYLDNKRSVERNDDPARTLRDGWDSHVAWAVAHPVYYRVIFSPFAKDSRSAEEARDILVQDLDRAAAAGRLQVPASVASQMIMAANVGVALMLINRPDAYDDSSLSTRVRDALHAQVLVATDSDSSPPHPADRAATTLTTSTIATTLTARIGDENTPGFTAAERSLLLEWLDRIGHALPE